MFATTGSQFDAVSEAFRGIVARLLPYQKAPAVQLEVHGGLNDQCVVDISLDLIRIGSDFDLDLVLIDPNVAPAHAEVCIVHSFLGLLTTIRATGQGVCVNGVPLAPGTTSKPIRLPLDLQIVDGISLRVGKGEIKRSRRLSSLERAIGSLKLAMLLLFVAAAGLYAWHELDVQGYVVRPSLPNTTAGLTVESSPVGIDKLQAKLAEVELGNVVRVSQNADGLLVVEGHLNPAQWSTWQQIASWYDSVSYGSPIIVQLLRGASFSKVPPISMIRLSEPKEIILATGEALSIDDTFTDDWVISAIEENGIVIARGSETETFNFAGPDR
jgi:hypothetical protein